MAALTLAFSKTGIGPVVKRGPYPAVHFDAEVLRGDGEQIARHQNHCWCIGAEEFFRIDVNGPVRAYFQDANGERSAELGPFLHFSSADGMSYADGEQISHVDVDASQWYSHRHQRHFKEMVVVPAG
jgi:hypothetical protein